MFQFVPSCGAPSCNPVSGFSEPHIVSGRSPNCCLIRCDISDPALRCHTVRYKSYFIRTSRAETRKPNGRVCGFASLVKSPNNHLLVQARQLLLRALDSALWGQYTIHSPNSLQELISYIIIVLVWLPLQRRELRRNKIFQVVDYKTIIHGKDC